MGRMVEWAAISFSRGSSQPGIKPRSPALQADSLPLNHQGSRDENSTLKVWNQEILRAWLDAPAAGMAAGDSSRKGMSLVQAVLRARGRGSSYLREMCGQNKLVNHLRSSSHNEGPKKQKTFFSENIHRQGNSLEVPWLGLLCFHCTEHRLNLRPGSWDLTC